MPTFTWDHVHLRTPDPEATAQWFERMFGAEIIRSTMLGKPRVDIKLGGAMIFTAQVNPGDGVNPAPTTPYQGLDHFGLAVSGHRRRSPPISRKRRRVHPGTALAAARHQNMLPARATGHFDRTA